MTQLTVLTDTPENAALPASWLIHIDFVKRVDDDPIQWDHPGRPATEEEILQMLEECEKSEGEMNGETFFDTWLKK